MKNKKNTGEEDVEYLFQHPVFFFFSIKSIPKTHHKNTVFFLNEQIYSFFLKNNFDFPFF